MMTSSVETIIQAVSPLLGTGAGAADAAAAGAEAAAAAAGAAAAAAVAGAAEAAASAGLASDAEAAGAAAGACAMTAPVVNRLSPSTREASSFFMSMFSLCGC